MEPTSLNPRNPRAALARGVPFIYLAEFSGIGRVVRRSGCGSADAGEAGDAAFEERDEAGIALGDVVGVDAARGEADGATRGLVHGQRQSHVHQRGADRPSRPQFDLALRGFGNELIEIDQFESLQRGGRQVGSILLVCRRRCAVRAHEYSLGSTIDVVGASVGHCENVGGGRSVRPDFHGHAGPIVFASL